MAPESPRYRARLGRAGDAMERNANIDDSFEMKDNRFAGERRMEELEAEIERMERRVRDERRSEEERREAERDLERLVRERVELTEGRRFETRRFSERRMDESRNGLENIIDAVRREVRHSGVVVRAF